MRVVGLLLLVRSSRRPQAWGAALLAAPSVADLPARVAALERSAHARALPLWRIAPVLREAVVATEDERFYQHADGVDLISIARVVPYDVGHGLLAQGASTIDEQLKVVDLQRTDHSPWEKRPRSRSGFASVTGSRTSRPSTTTSTWSISGEAPSGSKPPRRRISGATLAALDLAQASLLAGGHPGAESLRPARASPRGTRTPDRGPPLYGAQPVRDAGRRGRRHRETAGPARRIRARGRRTRQLRSGAAVRLGPAGICGACFLRGRSPPTPARAFSPRRCVLRHAARLAGLALFVAGVLTAVHSVQVL